MLKIVLQRPRTTSEPASPRHRHAAAAAAAANNISSINDLKKISDSNGGVNQRSATRAKETLMARLAGWQRGGYMDG